ncbi:MAG TPA: TonB-dependent receptor [Gemmatimonadales bacterium]|nr:TonB-dependent receptor [Gemmatimonadales bacterium]
MMNARAVAVGIALALGLPALAATSAAQSITAGELSGTVSDSLGQPLDGADVIVSDRASGVQRVALVARGGRFRFSLLPAGEYEVFAEALGSRPRRMLGVPVRPGVVLDVTLLLAPAPPPVKSVDTSYFGAGVYQGISTASGRWLAPFTVSDLPENDRTLPGVAALSTNREATLAGEGLPASFSGLEIDGLPVAPIRHQGFPADPGSAFPRGAFVDVQQVDGGPDVEWTGFAGGALSGFSRQGTATPQVRSFVDYTGSALSSSKFFATDGISNSSIRGGMYITGPIIPDTAHFLLGVEAQRIQAPLPAAWSNDSLVNIARDSFATDLSPYARTRLATTQRVSLFGRFDWQLTDDNALGVSAYYGNDKLTNADLGAGAIPSIGSNLRQSSFAASVVLASTISPAWSSELRAGVQVNSRTDTSTGPIGTWVPGTGAAFGTAPGLIGQFQRTAILVRESLQWRTGPHRLKLGAEVTAPSYQVTSAYGQGGAFWFGGPAELAARQGEFVQAVGSLPQAQVSAPQFGGFLQDTWNAAPGFDVLVGARYDIEKFPETDIGVNQVWQDSTSLSTNPGRTKLTKFSPRVGATWDVGDRHQWLVSVEGGSFSATLDPAVLGAMVAEDGAQGSVNVRRGFGPLTAWPNAPDSVHAPVIGQRLTLLGPNFEVPRTRRFAADITGALGAGFELHLDGVYRHTDFLERRTDLNLLPGPSGSDQYGRPVYGTLVQSGGLLGAQPGSNRRFGGFDLVSALNPDGFSDYYGLTVGVERSLGDVKLIASYTYSQTTDNWLSGWLSAGDPAGQLSPFPAGLGGRDWAKGTSDYDVPSRLTLATDLTLRRLHGTHLMAVFRYQSGYPFTPGFRPGVDANADGASNDPAFVDDTVSGMAAVIGKNACLRSQVGQFAQRNSCRTAGVSALDLRLEVPTVNVGGYPLSLTVDLLNLLESDVGLVDQALYLVDPSRSTTAAGAVTRVPLKANPNFGQMLIRSSSGRFLRVGLRVNW